MRSKASTVAWLLAGVVTLSDGLEAVLALCVVCRVYAAFVPCPDCVSDGRRDRDSQRRPSR
jgi:hypothetical protein